MASSTPTSATANLVYSVSPEGGEAPYQYLFGDYKTNVSKETKQLVIENVRGKEHTVSLDTTGFEFHKHASKHTSFANDDEIRNEYYPDNIEIIKKVTGASRVVVFDHTIRGPNVARQPVSQVHIDQTTAASIARVHRHLPASEAPKLLEKRFQIINLWRPIKHPAFDWPLALCDYRSVDLQNDPFPVKTFFEGREGETMGVRYNENHKWKYLYGMTPEEFVLIKCFDSVQDGSVAVFTPHTGFQDPNTQEGAPPRESIEIRALVFYD